MQTGKLSVQSSSVAVVVVVVYQSTRVRPDIRYTTQMQMRAFNFQAFWQKHEEIEGSNGLVNLLQAMLC